MTERFTETVATGVVTDNKTGIEYNCEMRIDDDFLHLINNLAEEDEQLKQFQEQVASVIESKMEDNVCNDYKMEVLKEIWNELELDEVWFE